MMRELVLGLEVVLADGRVLPGLSTLRKDNTGYDLKSLFLGSEGTLGVITAASLRLFPPERELATAFVAVPGVAAAVELLARLREASGDRVSSFELLPRVAVELTTAHIAGVAAPLRDGSPWYVLCELGSARAGEPLQGTLEAALLAAHEAGSRARRCSHRAAASARRSGGCASPCRKRSGAPARASSTTSRYR
ncbi:MAG: FAD-linked oxidase C-terminal domain-containing protein [Steroidobacteraceae bacterium]